VNDDFTDYFRMHMRLMYQSKIRTDQGWQLLGLKLYVYAKLAYGLLENAINAVIESSQPITDKYGEILNDKYMHGVLLQWMNRGLAVICNILHKIGDAINDVPFFSYTDTLHQVPNPDTRAPDEMASEYETVSMQAQEVRVVAKKRIIPEPFVVLKDKNLENVIGRVDNKRGLRKTFLHLPLDDLTKWYNDENAASSPWTGEILQDMVDTLDVFHDDKDTDDPYTMDVFIDDMYLFGAAVTDQFEKAPNAHIETVRNDVKKYMQDRTNEGRFINETVAELKQDLVAHAYDVRRTTNIYMQAETNVYNCLDLCHPLVDGACFDSDAVKGSRRKERVPGRIWSTVLRAGQNNAIGAQGSRGSQESQESRETKPLHICMFSVINANAPPKVIDPPNTPYVSYSVLSNALRAFDAQKSIIASRYETSLIKSIQRGDDKNAAAITISRRKRGSDAHAQENRCDVVNPVGFDVPEASRIIMGCMRGLAQVHKNIRCLPDMARKSLDVIQARCRDQVNVLHDLQQNYSRAAGGDTTNVETALINSMDEVKAIIDVLEAYNTSSMLGNIQFMDTLRRFGNNSVVDVNNMFSAESPMRYLDASDYTNAAFLYKQENSQ
jgi:hypothetical protein